MLHIHFPTKKLTSVRIVDTHIYANGEKVFREIVLNLPEIANDVRILDEFRSKMVTKPFFRINVGLFVVRLSRQRNFQITRVQKLVIINPLNNCEIIILSN